MNGIWVPVVEIVVGLAAFVVALGALAKSPYIGRPMRWLGRTLIVDPLGIWIDRVVRHATIDLEKQVCGIHKELHPNGGASFRDEVRRNHDEFKTFAKESSKDRASLHRHVEELRRDPFETLNELAIKLTDEETNH